MQSGKDINQIVSDKKTKNKKQTKNKERHQRRGYWEKKNVSIASTYKSIGQTTDNK